MWGGGGGAAYGKNQTVMSRMLCNQLLLKKSYISERKPQFMFLLRIYTWIFFLGECYSESSKLRRISCLLNLLDCFPIGLQFSTILIT